LQHCLAIKLYPPISTEKDDPTKTDETKRPKGKKDAYRVACFLPMSTHRMPLNAESPKDYRSLKYMHYYAGMQMAMEDLEQDGMNLTFDIYDSKEDVKQVESIINDQLPRNTDVIYGSLRKDVLMKLAEFGKENEIPVISPWYSSKSVTKENPYYIQLTPYLIDHYKAITEHALENFDPSQIFLLGRRNTKDVDRFKYFQKFAEEITDGEQLNTFTFYTDSLTQEYEIFKEVILRDSATVFILPNFSNRNDASYIYNVLRRINVEKMNHEVYVYGMPVLYDMDKISYEYYTNMNMRIVMSRFTDKTGSEVQSLNGRFYSRFNDFPLEDFYEGYDNILFLGRMLDEHGLDFMDHLNEDDQEYLSTKFNIEPVMKGEVENGKVNYYENKNLRIIQFVENQFRKIK